MAAQEEPVFLGGASEVERALVRRALASHPRFFTSHLPADDVDVLLAWAHTMAEMRCTRRPLWLSEAAFRCRRALQQVLPGARFIFLGTAADGEDAEGCLWLDPVALATSPAEAVDRILAFLGEAPGPALRRCA